VWITLGIKEERLGQFEDFWRDDRLTWIPVVKKHCSTGDEQAIADRDLGYLAEERGFDFLDGAKRGIGHWYAERCDSEHGRLGPDAAVEINFTPR
jgi:hypothetical protein